MEGKQKGGFLPLHGSFLVHLCFRSCRQWMTLTDATECGESFSHSSIAEHRLETRARVRLDQFIECSIVLSVFLRARLNHPTRPQSCLSNARRLILLPPKQRSQKPTAPSPASSVLPRLYQRHQPTRPKIRPIPLLLLLLQSNLTRRNGSLALAKNKEHCSSSKLRRSMNLGWPF